MPAAKTLSEVVFPQFSFPACRARRWPCAQQHPGARQRPPPLRNRNRLSLQSIYVKQDTDLQHQARVPPLRQRMGGILPLAPRRKLPAPADSSGNYPDSLPPPSRFHCACSTGYPATIRKKDKSRKNISCFMITGYKKSSTSAVFVTRTGIGCFLGSGTVIEKPYLRLMSSKGHTLRPANNRLLESILF